MKTFLKHIWKNFQTYSAMQYSTTQESVEYLLSLKQFAAMGEWLKPVPC